MQNTLMVFHTDTRYRSTAVAPVSPFASFDSYQTRTGDETALLPLHAAPTLPTNQCAECQGEACLIPAEKAAAICQCSRRMIYRWIDEGALHFRELPDGTVLVCGASLTVKLESLEDATGRLPR